MSQKINFDWTKFLMGLLSALMGALTASAAVAAAPEILTFAAC